jgi:hypothetical protein
MPEVIETTVYKYSELSDKAKEVAISWHRDHLHPNEWWDYIYDDFQRICDILGIHVKSKPVRGISGKLRAEPCIYFTGFWNQGDGACFEGYWNYAARAPARIRDYAPTDTALHHIADQLQAQQRRNFYQLVADVRHVGRNCHANSMVISVERNSPTGQPPTEGAEDVVTQILRDLACWLYRRLEDEYEFLTSDEVVVEGIIANEFRFTDDGQYFG